MNIITEIDKKKYERLRIFGKKQSVMMWYIQVVNKHPKKMKIGELAYFTCENKLVGYAIIDDFRIVNDETMGESIGNFWRIAGKPVITWSINYWYTNQLYIKSLEIEKWKYFDLKKWLNGRKEPDTIKTNKGGFYEYGE